MANVVALPSPIERLVTEIRSHLYDAQGAETKLTKHRLAAGQKLLELRARIEKGEAGEVNWWEWYATQFTRSRKDAEKLMRIARSDDPDGALEAERTAARERMKDHRASQPEDAESDNLAAANVRGMADREDYDIVNHALALVARMDEEERERFDAAYREKYDG